MTYEAEVQFKFDATYTHDYTRGFGSSIDDDYIPEEHYLITAPAGDLNAKQYFKLFEKFMLCVGMSPSAIHTGAMSLVFDDMVDEKDQRKVCEEYDLTMNEDLNKKFEEWKDRDEEWAKMRSHYKKNVVSEPKIKDDHMPPWGHSDMEALIDGDVN
jgi:quinol monooxygenase YgiN